MSAHPLLAIESVTVRFGGLLAVDDVSFTVAEGELLGLIGPNGAGKTTMLRAITGVVRPTSGQVLLDGKRLNEHAINERIRMGLALSQQLVRPLRGISLQDNVAMAAASSKTRRPLGALLQVSDAHELAQARQELERVGIAHLAEQSPATQPLGVLKRLELARALALKPRLLLLDEPLAGLNSKEAHGLADTIAEINAQGVTVVLIEHNLGEVLRICRRLVVLDNGRKIAEGEPQAVMAQPVVRSAYLGSETRAEEEADHA
ncbi:ABC transporter ATP-binding protein [Comamonas flocculans]|uniref:ATP-binding cassette domain-containing protein n=1 Tax=Comamonas flocculans TaxID=2597701 RepID=A0A5B8RUH7_9BURK|nr:ATP-binding cassette domain-containing protein [Comamonas flocculans]MCD6662078.1 ATP-binding cassette domain-containing protein [Comamonas sp.]QEA12753.1 ATP-binding cassette domain-containing protein [Comamonas flocculans]